ncbi:MAG: MFS transporter [Ignavibacterium sp.]|nr:MFS transporter [Ignavibacterium sp.]
MASGFILASMSLGWPTSSALSGKLYMRIGFRDTSIIRAVFVLLAFAGFLFIPRPQPVYLLVTDQVLLGAGFGLLSTPSLVGIQSMVAWQQRGVVTSANMFSRNLGQSLGAAIIGAIFNNSFLHQMKSKPSDIPDSIKDIIGTFHSSDLVESSKEFLRGAINISMQNVYLGLVFFTFLIILCLYIVPQRSAKDKTLIDTGR